MPRPPALSGRDVVREFQRLGWQIVRQNNSHISTLEQGSVATCQIANPVGLSGLFHN